MTAPCLKRLDADCFRAHPAWAKRAFAYRLVHLLTPKPLTKRLPKGLRLALIAPGVEIPPGVELPPGVVVSPGAEVPPGWSSEIVAPPGITIPPGTVFPPGWSPGDPLPDGVTLDPGATFPPGWSPGDPLPPGAIPPGTLPPGVETTGPTPPTYVAPWEPGPINPPGIHIPVAGEVITVVTGGNPDGYAFIAGTWAYCQAATSSQSKDVTCASDQYGQCARDFFGTKYIYRCWYSFDLSTIPAGNTCLSAILTLGGYVNAQGTVVVQEGTQGDLLLTTDFKAFAGVGFATATWQVSGAGGTNLNQFTFNAAGLTYLEGAFGGRAQLCGREYDHDYLNKDPGSGIYNNGVYYSEATDEALRPILTITHA